ncbi:exodeoxyribonuclease V subunit alpha [Psychrosphaera aestuarii]|uniref:exodeoxyribonuclease V subunit alpha n=1 Tax=Psychrosphaera aestuarii TaxID=1266052 RepID=UPI001B32596B|nr:exodeoxyribonuclease V subunit alpha [Psychrosphaera aestuarii]
MDETKLNTQATSSLNEANSLFIDKERAALPVMHLLKKLRLDGVISDADYHVGCYFGKELNLSKIDVFNLVVLVATRLSVEINRQNTCFALNQLMSLDWIMNANLPLPPQESWLAHLTESGVCGEHCPLVEANGFVYFNRYYQKELLVAAFIIAGQSYKPAHHWLPNSVLAGNSSLVDNLFTGNNDESSQSIDWQHRAVYNSLCHRFSVITGGPGTGKTTTVIKLLTALIEMYLPQPELIKRQIGSFTIKLAAPTGKAALRLTESITKGIEKLNISDEVKNLIPIQASTIHRLLKPLGQNEFYYNANNKLPIDVLVLDEASMVDLSLMAKLMAALPDHCQMVMIGDKQQLASVEAGNLLAEVCSPLTTMSDEQQNQLFYVTELKRSYRFDALGGIGLLAKAVNEGRISAVDHLLVENSINTDKQSVQAFLENSTVLSWLNQQIHSVGIVVNLMVNHHLTMFEQIVCLTSENEESQVKSLFEHLFKLQILCCVKQSQFGVEAINKLVKQRLSQLGHVDWHHEHYVGKPILVTENAYHLGLFNGDIGLQLPDPASGILMTYFVDGSGKLVKLFNQRLPAHEMVYAMTVHKSQGSEFDHTVLLMPGEETGNKLLSRELVYTAITRAKKRFTIFGDKRQILNSVGQHTQRQSGLSKLLFD